MQMAIEWGQALEPNLPFASEKISSRHSLSHLKVQFSTLIHASITQREKEWSNLSILSDYKYLK